MRLTWRCLVIMCSVVFGEVYQHLMLTVKHGGGEVMVWAYFVAMGSGQHEVIELTMTSLYTKILLKYEAICHASKLAETELYNRIMIPSRAAE